MVLEGLNFCVNLAVLSADGLEMGVILWVNLVVLLLVVLKWLKLILPDVDALEMGYVMGIYVGELQWSIRGCMVPSMYC